MKRNRNTRILTAASALCVSAWCASTALGQLSLTNIPPATHPVTQVTDTSNEGRAITHDAKYVGGLSGTGNGFFYDVASNYVTIPLAGSYASIITGIAYRTDTNQTPAVVQVVLDGNNSGYHGQYATWDGGYTWGVKRRDLTYALSAYPGPAVNSLAGTTDSDVFINIFRTSDRKNVYTSRGSNLWDSVTAATNVIVGKGMASDLGDVYGVAVNGRIVGYRTSSGVRRNTLYDYPNSSGTQFQFNGLAGTLEGEAWSVSQDGTCIFGRSPISPGGTTTYGYKTVISGFKSGTNSPTQISVNQLPTSTDTAGSTSLAVPYGCTADGKYAVGMNYRGRETAVLWDTTSSDTNVWTVNDLYGLAAANGTADIFTRLTRAYSVGTNAAGDPVITGIGWDGASNRAFLMTVPKWIAAIGFPGNQTVKLGANVSIALKTNGTDSLTYQWYKDGNEMPGQTTTALSLNNVSCAGGQAGVYSVVVSNAPISAVVTGAMTLTVLDPYFLTQPSSQTNLDGTIATFAVSADGAPTLSYKWQRGGVDLTDGDTGWGSTIYGATTPTLTISNVQPFDAMSGDYTAIVTTSAGGCSATSRAVTLTVLVRPVLSTYVDSTGGNYTLSFDGPFGLTYEVRFSTDITLPLTSWTVLTTDTFFGPAIYTDIAPPDQQRFYIVNVVYP